MKKPIHILLPAESIDNLYYDTALSKPGTYQLQNAHNQSWHYPDFNLWEQYVDARDAFICLTELHCHIPVDLGIRCDVADIFWLYQLEGSFIILDPANNLDTVLHTQAQHYTQVYVPQQSYVCRFPKGHHLLFYFVFQPKWLQRQGARAMEGFHHLLKKQHEKHTVLSHNGLLPIDARIRQQLLSLFTLAKMKSLLREIKIYEHCFHLLDLSQEDLHFQEEQIKIGDHLLEAVRKYIWQQLENGKLPPLYDIAHFFKISPSRLREKHLAIYGYSLQRYIWRKKQEIAAELLKSRQHSISEISYRLGYSDIASFSRSFKKYHGVSPSDFYKKLKLPPI